MFKRIIRVGSLLFTLSLHRSMLLESVCSNYRSIPYTVTTQRNTALGMRCRVRTPTLGASSVELGRVERPNYRLSVLCSCILCTLLFFPGYFYRT